MDSIAVTSRSFSKNPILRKKILKLYPNVKFNDEGLLLNGDKLVKFLKGYKKAIIALETIDDNIIKQLPELKVISKYGVGLDNINLKVLKKYGIKLGWTAGVNKLSVAELVISHAISLLHKVIFANSEVKKKNGIR